MKVLAFGDSFVKMFLHCEPEVKHWKFKGKSVKGLVKQDDLERRKIERQVRKTQTGTKILMFFGQVDFNYVRYYKVIKGQPPITEQIFKKYVQWVSSLNNRKNISIVSIFPSPIEKSSVISSLVNKGSYLLEEQTPEIDEKILAEYDKSAATWELWNTWINNYCQKYGVNNIKLFKENRLEPQFYDISKLTIHLRYVPVLKLVKNYVDIKFDAEKAEQIEKQYEVQKVNRIANSNFTLPGEQTPKQIPKENNILSLNSQQKQSSFFEQNTKVEVGIKEQIQRVQKIEEVPSKEAQLSEEVIKNQRKQTADLDTDTNLEKQSDKSKQTEQQLQKQEYGGIVRSSSDLPVQSQSQKKKSKKQPLNKKSKSTKQKEKEKEKEKEKKKYISIEKSESDSEGDGERFLQLASKGRRKY